MSGLSSDGGPTTTRSAAVKERRSLFWTFSLAVYGHSAVQTECLDLQDRYGIDVNMLLFCAYVGAAYGAVLPDAELHEATALVNKWHKHVVQNLREARRALKPFAAAPSPRGAAAGLRGNVKAAELEAERIEQITLEEWSALRIDAWPRAEPAAAVAANIVALLATCGRAAPQPQMPDRLVAAALAAARSTSA